MARHTLAVDIGIDELIDEQETTKTSHYKQYALIVHNDDDHSFEYVIICFNKIFHYPQEKCLELAIRIHKEGRALVYSGMLEHVELKDSQIQRFGPDVYAQRQVAYPLRTEIREL